MKIDKTTLKSHKED